VGIRVNSKMASIISGMNLHMQQAISILLVFPPS